MEQLSKTLMDLLGFYDTAQAMGVPTPNSPEFKEVLTLPMSPLACHGGKVTAF